MEEHFHAVRFYQDDSSLCRIVADFIGDGIRARQPAVVIATPSHRAGISGALGAAGFDLERLRGSGELLLIDAEEMLATFMREGAPDSAAFGRHVGAVFDSAVGSRRGVTLRAYGEMVDWLWKHDASDAAIRLELLWNEIAQTRDFALLCGYSMGNFYKHGAYEEICARHTHVMCATGQPTRISVA